MTVRPLLQPLDRLHFAAGRFDPSNRFARVLHHRRHVMGVGVHDSVAIPHDRDVAFPENQVAALQLLHLGGTQCPAETVLLHIAVARAAGAGGVERYLDEAGAIDAERALAAPEIWRAGEAL